MAGGELAAGLRTPRTFVFADQRVAIPFIVVEKAAWGHAAKRVVPVRRKTRKFRQISRCDQLVNFMCSRADLFSVAKDVRVGSVGCHRCADEVREVCQGWRSRTDGFREVPAAPRS